MWASSSSSVGMAIGFRPPESRDKRADRIRAELPDAGPRPREELRALRTARAGPPSVAGPDSAGRTWAAREGFAGGAPARSQDISPRRPASTKLPYPPPSRQPRRVAAAARGATLSRSLMPHRAPRTTSDNSTFRHALSLIEVVRKSEPLGVASRTSIHTALIGWLTTSAVRLDSHGRSWGRRRSAARPVKRGCRTPNTGPSQEQDFASSFDSGLGTRQTPLASRVSLRAERGRFDVRGAILIIRLMVRWSRENFDRRQRRMGAGFAKILLTMNRRDS
jgi:hypothetical protein